jgi:UDP-glucose 4-epimerase
MGELKTIGITGIFGFKGVHLANELIKRGYKVVGFDNMSHPTAQRLDKRAQVIWGDVRNSSDCFRLANSVNAIIHLAAEISVDKSIQDPERVIDVNVLGTKNMLEACRITRVPLLIASSSEVYGTAETNIQTEKHPLQGQSPYAATKIAADRLGYAYHITYGMDVRIVRSFNVCGEGQGFDSYGAVIAIFANKIKNGEPIEIFGSGAQTRDYTHVSDTVAGYITILEKGKPGEVYNIATGRDWSVNQLVNKLARLSGKPVTKIKAPARAGEVYKLRGDARKLRKLGWKPKVSFDEALKRIWKAAT